ncbi:MAG: hypothetical protein V7L20_05115, partial [Nostoc sp.]|uniref:hypothetical protein n=1 Tax=Nostoc sp. TaxID=1180 RepID=UPI002FF763F4
LPVPVLLNVMPLSVPTTIFPPICASPALPNPPALVNEPVVGEVVAFVFVILCLPDKVLSLTDFAAFV